MLALKVILLVIVAMPVTLVLVGVMLYQRERRLLRSAVRKLVCPACSARLSDRSIQIADELWQRHVATIMAQNPGFRLRMAARTVDVVCESCGARLQFDQKSRTVRPVSIVLAFEKE